MTAAELAYKTSATGATEADDLVLQELPQVYYIAARIRERLPQHVEMEDLVSAGVVGLLEATRSFDGSKNVQFKTFAKFRIRGAILDSLRETDWGSRYMRRRGREIAEVTARLEARLDGILWSRRSPKRCIWNRAPAQADCAARFASNCGQKVAVSNDRSESLDVIESAPNLDDHRSFEICLERRDEGSPRGSNLKTQRERAIDLVSLLSRRADHEEISKVVGVALSRVSQIRQETMVKLKAHLEH